MRGVFLVTVRLYQLDRVEFQRAFPVLVQDKALAWSDRLLGDVVRGEDGNSAWRCGVISSLTLRTPPKRTAMNYRLL